MEGCGRAFPILSSCFCRRISRVCPPQERLTSAVGSAADQALSSHAGRLGVVTGASLFSSQAGRHRLVEEVGELRLGRLALHRAPNCSPPPRAKCLEEGARNRARSHLVEIRSRKRMLEVALQRTTATIGMTPACADVPLQVRVHHAPAFASAYESRGFLGGRACTRTCTGGKAPFIDVQESARYQR